MSVSLLAIDERVVVSGQLQPQDMRELAAAGYVAVVNNRPDGEALFGQPRTADLKRAAEAAGLVFLDLPFSGPRATVEQVRAFADLLAERPGRVVAYCKSGLRSSLLWGALAIAQGKPLDEVLGAARRAGQALEGVADAMMALGQAARR
jgi:uncharacterized protein (TIGR01244 family)